MLFDEDALTGSSVVGGIIREAASRSPPQAEEEVPWVLGAESARSSGLGRKGEGRAHLLPAALSPEDSPTASVYQNFKATDTSPGGLICDG